MIEGGELLARLRNVRVLLLEDDALISADAEDMLAARGAQVLVAHTNEAARSLLDCEEIEIAVLDRGIGTDTSDPVARLLQQRAIPFVFASGYSDGSDAPDDLRDVPHVQKPYSEETLIAAVSAVLGLAQPEDVPDHQ